MEPKGEHAVKAEIAAAKTSAQQQLPQLLAQRQRLEREAGAIGVSARNRKRVAVVLAVIAAIIAAFSIYKTVTADPPIFLYILAAIPGFIAAFMMFESESAESAREKELQSLHDRMLTIGRQISRAEKTLKD